jgi:hypothetical protein
LLASNRNIRGIDASALVDVFPEIGCNDSLKRLLPNRRHIGGVHAAGAIHIA